jgi:hypothetical protein
MMAMGQKDVAKRGSKQLIRTREQVVDNNMSVIAYLFCILFVTFLLPACSVLTLTGPNTEIAGTQAQRISLAQRELLALDDIDTVIKLNNRWLSEQFYSGLEAQAGLTDTYKFLKLKASFSRQFITLNTIVEISDQDGNVISASIAGEILLDPGPGHLDWSVHFDKLSINSKEFTFEGSTYTEPLPELSKKLLQKFNSDISQALTGTANNRISLNAVPLGHIQVGAEIPGLSTSTALHKETLRGTFITARSASLIDSSHTTVALDLAFLPNISNCPAKVGVSRAAFARDIQSREPVDVAGYKQHPDDIRYFFTEITGAKQPLTIIHYWYKNGQAVAFEELTVGASRRWRTWSSGGGGQVAGDLLEVLIVEKETGCTLLSKSIHLPEPKKEVTPANLTSAKRSFAKLRQGFEDRTHGFLINKSKPPIAVIKTRRDFIAEALKLSLVDLNISAEFDQGHISPLQLKGNLQAFAPGDIICEQRTCPPVTECKTNISHCKRFRDSRDCTSCLFRNPLNNRCMSEAIDPLCEASKARQNNRYDGDRALCISYAEVLRDECDFLNAQADRSCQIESGFADNACDSVRKSITDLKPGAPLASIRTQVHTKGKLGVNFSNFRIEGDLERLKLDMALSSKLEIQGDISFRPSSKASPLAQCISSWSSAFKSRFANAPTVNNFQSKFEQGANTLVANWSGFGLVIDTKPSPLKSILLANPQLLANCKIGLTVAKVEQAISGDDSDFYRGKFELEVQPLPTILQLAPASLIQGESVYSAQALLTDTHLNYEIDY